MIIWDLYTGNRVKTIDDYKGKAYHVSLDKNEKIISVSGSNNDISLYQFTGGSFIGFLRNGHTKETIFSEFSTRGDQLISVGKDNQLILWNIASKRVLRKSEINPRTINESATEIDTAEVLPSREKILIA